MFWQFLSWIEGKFLFYQISGEILQKLSSQLVTLAIRDFWHWPISAQFLIDWTNNNIGVDHAKKGFIPATSCFNCHRLLILWLKRPSLSALISLRCHVNNQRYLFWQWIFNKAFVTTFVISNYYRFAIKVIFSQFGYFLSKTILMISSLISFNKNVPV